jgi:hypothetical protein
MGVVNGTPVNATNTNAAFLNKNQADQMTFPASFTSNLSLSKRDESSAATLNALTTTTSIVRITGTVTTINGAVAPTTYVDGQLLIISNASGSSVTINHESGSATAANRFTLPNAVLLTVGSGSAASFYYDTTASRWRPSAGSGSGGGATGWISSYPYQVGNIATYTNNGYICVVANTSGATFEADYALGYWVPINSPAVGKNYMAVGSNFESNTLGGWQLVTTSLTNLIPTGAPTIGSAASLSIGVTGTNPLSGLYSLTLGNIASTNIAAGQGIISQAFAISPVDQAKVLTSRFAYSAVANLSTALMNFSGTSSNTWAVYLYDVTNAAWIQPAGVYGMTQSSGVGIEAATWQTPSNMTQFRLAILCVNATTGTTPAANAYQLYFDEFFTGSQAITQGSPITDWQDFPSVAAGTLITGTTTSPTYGTVAYNRAQWRRVGSDMEVRWDFRQTTAGTAGSGTYLFNLPPGFSIDTNKVSPSSTNDDSKSLGTFDYYDVGATAIGIGYASAYSSTQLRFTMQAQAASGSLGTISSSYGQLSNTSISYALKARIPILGWSSNVQSSADTETRVVDLTINPTSSITPTGTISSSFASCTTINFNTTPSKDSHGAYSGGVYTVPVSGDYWCSVKFETQGTGGTFWEICFVVNGVQIADGASKPTANNQYISGGVVLQNLKAGDLLTIRLRTDCTSPVFTTSIVHALSLFRLSGPSVIASTESLSARYDIPIGTSASSTTPWNASTKIWDTHGAVTTGASWKFTAPISGVFQIEAWAFSAATSYVAYVYKNGVQDTYSYSTLTTTAGSPGVVLMRLVAGDYIDVRPTVAVTSASYVGHISILRVGN